MEYTIDKTVVESKLVFNHFRVTKYSDGTYRYENYPYFFKDQVSALKWGRSMDEASKIIRDAQKHIDDLLNEVTE